MTKHAKILLVEDEEALANVLKLELKNAGFEVTHCDNGKDAVAKAKNNKFDLILLDVVMPTMDGFETLKQMKADNINVKTLMLSNLSQEEEIEKAKRLGAIGFIVKSNTTLAEIIDQIKKLLDNK
jgi:DNA-binding response OmpR family regulator